MSPMHNEDVIATVFAAAAMRDDGAAGQLRNPGEVRRRAHALLARARAGNSENFTVNDAALDAVADALAYAIRQGKHKASGSSADGHARLDMLLGPVGSTDRVEKIELVEHARAHVDLAFVTVLLQFEPMVDWVYRDAGTGQVWSGLRGAALASFDAFSAGLFSSDPARPYQVDAAGLRGLNGKALGQQFQTDSRQPSQRFDDRVALLRRIGEILSRQEGIFGPGLRPAGLFDSISGAEQHEVPPTAEVGAHDILITLLMTLSPVWPAENTLGEHRLGDCWRLPAAHGPGLTDGWMPLHRLGQALTYALIRAFEHAGVPVRNIEALTPLAESHSSGLLMDLGVLNPRNAWVASHVADPAVVELRALTVALTEELGPRIRSRVHDASSALPLAVLLAPDSWRSARLTHSGHSEESGLTAPWDDKDPAL
jgi:hypothetical protein